MSLAQDRCTQTCPRRDKQLMLIRKDGVRRPLCRYCASRNVDQVQSSKRGGRLASLPFPSCTLASDDPGIVFLWRVHTIHKVPSHQPEVCFFNVPGDLLPLILFLDPPPCRLACRLLDRRIRNQEAQPVCQIRSTSTLKHKSRASDDFAVFR